LAEQSRSLGERKLAEQSRSLGERIWPSNQEVSVKGFGRATKKSQLQGSWPSNQEVSAARNLAEQSRSLGSKEFG
jgi:hypothetical protein